MSVYNDSANLHESINSILNQTFSDIEFIIINDASTDTSLDIIRDYSAKDNRIQIITNKINQGLALSLNKGLHRVRGKYIARHDADDLSLPERLEVQFKFMETHPEIFLIGAGSVVIDKDGKDNAVYCYTSDEEVLRRNLLHENQLQHPSIMFRNDHEHYYRDKFRYSQDYDFHLRLLNEGKRLINLPDILIKRSMASCPLPSQKGAQQLLFAEKAKEFYHERTDKCNDSYDDFDPSPILEIDIDTTLNPIVLRSDIMLLLRAKKLKETRSCIRRYWISCGYFNKYILIWASTFLGKKLLTTIQRFRRKLRKESPMVFIKEKSGDNHNDRQNQLALFSTNGVGLKDWERIGSLSREVALYKRLNAKGWGITFFTYDKTRNVPDVGFPAKVITQFPFRLHWRLGFIYQALLSIIRFRHGKSVSVIITNQAHSGWPAIVAGKLWGAKVMARCGYVFGEQAETMNLHGRYVQQTIRNEKWTFRHADICIISTRELADWVIRNYGIKKEKIYVIPNNVDTNIFQPMKEIRKDIDILCVGRMAEEKRYNLVLKALNGLDIKVVFIGDGVLKEQIECYATDQNVRLEIISRVINEEIPKYHNRTKIYLIASRGEGHPKSLIEAMACGCACIGTRTPGTKNQIVDGETGILVDSDSQSIRSEVKRLLNDKALRHHLGGKARHYALTNWSLDIVTIKYTKILRKILNDSQ